jgi:hypothetical protein
MDATTTDTVGECAMKALRGFGKAGASAADLASIVRKCGHGVATAPGVAARLRKYAKRGACRVEWVTTREGDTEMPARQEERFYA